MRKLIVLALLGFVLAVTVHKPKVVVINLGTLHRLISEGQNSIVVRPDTVGSPEQEPVKGSR